MTDDDRNFPFDYLNTAFKWSGELNRKVTSLD